MFLALLPFHFVSCTHAILIFLLCMMSAISLLFPVILPMFAVVKRTCRFCVLARFFIRSRLCRGSPSHSGTFGRVRGRSLEGDFLALACFFIRSRLCCGSPSHTGIFGRGRGRSLEVDFLTRRSTASPANTPHFEFVDLQWLTLTLR